MLRKWLAILIVWLLSIGVAMSQEGGVAQMELVQSDNGELELVFSCPLVGLSVGVDGYVTLNVVGTNMLSGHEGAPMLPTMSHLVTLPRGVRFESNEELGKMNEELDAAAASGFQLSTFNIDGLIAPTPQAVAKDDEPAAGTPDKRIYGTDGFYRPSPIVGLEHIGTMGGSEVYRVIVAPVDYNPVRGEVRVITNGRMTVGSLADASSSPALPRPASLMSELSTSNHQPATSNLNNRYLVVAPTMFREGLQRFVQWKRQEGFVVVEIYVETNDRDSIKAMIGDHWPLATSYILLVGDAGLIPPFDGTSRPEGFSTHTTDLYYAEFTGDYLPDALLGRWPVNDTAELRRVVDKTLSYEQCLELDTAHLRRALLVAGKESQQPAPTTTNGQVNYVAGRLTELLPELDTLCYHNPASDTQRVAILGDIAEGTAVVNYTAHCTTSGWSRPSVNNAAIDSLDESRPTVYINNCCLSNAFDGDGFGERLLRKERGGGVAVVGATNSTMWNEDYYWAVGPKYPFSLQPEYDSQRLGAFDVLLESGQWPVATVADILVGGNMAVTAFGSPFDKFYWEIYCLLGDPALKPYLGTPRSLWMAVGDTLHVGATTMVVGATPGATVTAVQGERLLAVTTADVDGNAVLTLALPVDTLPLLVTATAPQAIPAVDTILPALPQGVALSFRHVEVSDTAVDFTLVYFGDDTIYNPVVTLQYDTTGALFIATAHLIDSLLPHSELPLHTALSITRWASQWSGTLEAWDADGNVRCSLRIEHSLDPVPTLAFTLLNADGSVASSVLPNTEYILGVNVEGTFDTLAVNASAMYHSSDYPLLPTPHSPLSTFTTPDSLTHLHLHGYVGRGSYGRDYDYWLTADCREESFEEGFGSHPWNITTIRPWVLDSTVSHSGRYSLRSAPIDYRQTSDLLIDLHLMADDSIVFLTKVISDDGDKVSFSVDGQHRGSWSGNIDWHRRAYPLSAGHHRLRWRYTKDESGNLGSDCGWIDDLRLPLALWDTAWGWFGCTAEEPEPQGIAPIAVGMPVVYPNPTERMVNIGIAGELTLADIYGRIVLTTYVDDAASLDLGNLAAGVYIATLRRGETIYHFKLTRK